MLNNSFFKSLKLPSSWCKLLKDEINSEYFSTLINFLEGEYNSKTIFPKIDDVFSLFRKLDYEDIKVVIIGQDPYHGQGQGNGLAFSVNQGVDIPPSLRNIFKELENQYINSPTPFTKPISGDLTSWVNQGVFLLNSVLTVREKEANSHKGKGWEEFTDSVITLIGKRDTPTVFILWGGSAISKRKLIKPHHLILEAPHPSPLSAYRGFFGCNHFVKCNEFLLSNNMTPIDWRIG